MKLPPLNALRAFDAAARLGRVKAAAAELFVTPAAVSQQVKLLEDFIGTALFERRPRGLRLSNTGFAYHQAVGRHLRGISEATERLRPKRHAVGLSSVPTFAASWLAPRLPLFTRAQPGIEIRVEADAALVDFRSDAFDLAIRETTGGSRDSDTVMLFPLSPFPVAAPGYVKSLTRAGRFDWRRARLLHEGNNEYWDAWLDARGVSADTGRGYYFSHGMLAFAAASSGEGVALASYCLVERALRERRLAIVDPMALPTGRGYWLAWPKSSVRSTGESAALLREWIIAEAAQTRAGAERATHPPRPPRRGPSSS